MAILSGSCLCGGVRFEIPEGFEGMAFCHCATCKKLSGGVATANARVRTDAIRIVEGQELVRTYQPDAPILRGSIPRVCRSEATAFTTIRCQTGNARAISRYAPQNPRLLGAG